MLTEEHNKNISMRAHRGFFMNAHISFRFAGGGGAERQNHILFSKKLIDVALWRCQTTEFRSLNHILVVKSLFWIGTKSGKNLKYQTCAQNLLFLTIWKEYPNV